MLTGATPGERGVVSVASQPSPRVIMSLDEGSTAQQVFRGSNMREDCLQQEERKGAERWSEKGIPDLGYIILRGFYSGGDIARVTSWLEKMLALEPAPGRTWRTKV